MTKSKSNYCAISPNTALSDTLLDPNNFTSHDRRKLVNGSSLG